MIEKKLARVGIPTRITWNDNNGSKGDENESSSFQSDERESNPCLFVKCSESR